jgi:hypothetical protein
MTWRQLRTFAEVELESERLLPGLTAGVLLVERYVDHFLAMLATLIGAVVLCYLALLVTGTSIIAATEQGLLLGAASGQATCGRLCWQSWWLRTGQPSCGRAATLPRSSFWARSASC